MNPLVSRKEETRQRIVDTAARLFLEKGVDRVGVDEIMRNCGLTHGSFYVYFPCKDALISEACTAALDKTAQQWQSLASNLADDTIWNNFLSTYLAGDLISANNPACPVAILGADVARRQAPSQASYVARMKSLIDTIAKEAGSERSHAVVTFVALVGATSLAAQVGSDRRFAAELLNTTREVILTRPAKNSTEPRIGKRHGETGGR
ncbi:MAG TPA: TetR/AcrR family transcriptional regulator [Caulobacteraceae bacterium]|nr:TetR/AcrR family transcriptional regulator [Caulobacteraceae bacterium]